jgi:hypothetical protein
MRVSKVNQLFDPAKETSRCQPFLEDRRHLPTSYAAFAAELTRPTPLEYKIGIDTNAIGCHRSWLHLSQHREMT